MTGTGRRRWLVGVGVLVVVAVVLTGWLVLRDGDGDDGSDTTPTGELVWVARLTDLVRVEPTARTSPAAVGASLGEVVALLTTPQDVDTFAERYAIGPADMASQLATALASIGADVSPPSACGNRAQEMAERDTAFTIEVVAGAIAAVEGDRGPARTAMLVLPEMATPSERDALAAQIADGDFTAAAEALIDESGTRAARLVVGGLVDQLRGSLAAENDADYLTSFLSTYNFAANVLDVGCD